ncbi:Protein of unknown function DUF499 [Moorella glycerini]|uniref:ATP-binding protein n=1 Tax=Neomoorella stamsii TaxID=1266720 RepID=A0A9X7P6W1_9FIRM|nr:MULTISPECIES: DUF499 domain-containing protein [Moorella]PRR74606.1 hypothetical protein MOST_10410 [Moorella stamsii]CEP69107.1 Protein of unknown function DUF499 [Moorella glycerini]
MSKLPWTPWHQVVRLRDDVRSGELSLAVFAADLYDVVMGRAKPIYQDPAEFFALTYPTFNLRELAKDVLVRLAGKNEKAVRQLELTYGGGKTHTLITLYHLVSDPARLPDLPAVKEFIEHAGITPPKARVACLPFDKLDVEKGMAIKAPDGQARWLKHPWSVLAWQIAGAEGLRLLHPDGKDEERESAPAENLLAELLFLPGREGLSTLVLMDEVLVFAREKIGLDPIWRGRMQNFFQYLTQAATKVEHCAVVVSLLASDPKKSDALGKEIAKEMYDIFRREQEESIQPVVKEDVAEVLRRRLFTPESIRDREAFRPHVMAALKGINELDDQTKKAGKAAEERFLHSFPFHPDLTEVFYVKWTQLEGFQRTRGVLRTFALALREAEKWDQCPLIAANVFLHAPGSGEISPAARELTTVAASEEYEGKRQEWAGILEGELAKARAIQSETPGLKFREVEQAVLATFIHSQPIGQKALTRDLLALLGHTRPDRIELEKALGRWAEVSWFLDEEALSDVEKGGDGRHGLPKTWRLGSRPNLRQMHSEACGRVVAELIEAKLVETIGKMKSLTEGAMAAGARVHVLPERSKDIEDDGEFHYAVLGPKAASTAGNASAEAKRFIEETTGPDRPRVYRNAVVLAVPSREGLEIARERIREYLGWEEVHHMLKGQQLDPLRAELLSAYTEGAKKKIAEAVRQAYCLAVTVSEKNEILAYKLTVGIEPLFNTIKNDPRVRIQETEISAEALLPEGPYNLWREGETARRVKDLVGAFAQFPHLPKMLRRKEILETLIQGVREGLFVLRAVRPDRSVRTIWRTEPAEPDLKDPGLELVLPEAATLSEIPSGLLVPWTMPGLWPDPPEITVRDVVGYFRGGNVVEVPREGYTELVVIPGAGREVILAAVSEAVKTGKLWLTTEVASICAEEIPAGILTDDARLQPPPPPIPVIAVLPENLPEAWPGEETTALAIAGALSRKAGKPLPWATVREAINGAVKARLLEKTVDSGPWPCSFGGAQQVKLRVPTEMASPPESVPPLPPKPGFKVARAELRPHQIQDLAEVIGELVNTTVGYNLVFKLQVELGGVGTLPDEVVQKVNELLGAIAAELKLE